MSISNFISTSVDALPFKVNWFSGALDRSRVESAKVVLGDPKEGRMKEVLSMLNSIGALYSVPYLLFQKGHDLTEIANLLNLPEGTVKSRIFTARVKMKQMIAKRRAA